MTRFLYLFLFCLPTLAFAQTGPYNPPAGIDLLSSSVLYRGHPVVLSSMPNANYNLSQWGAPADFSAFQNTGNSWSTSDSFSGAVFTVNGNVVHSLLSQNGASVACLTSAGTPAELDLFIQPGNESVQPAYTSNFPALSALSSFKMAGTLTIDSYGASFGTTACVNNHANANYGIILTDTAVVPEQMLWYTINLFRVCVPGGDYAYCVHTIKNPISTWTWTGASGASPHTTKNSMGVVTIANFSATDPLQFYGVPGITARGSTPISINLLPRLAALIGGGPAGIDTNLRDWRLAGNTYGQSSWGSTLLQTEWSGFTIQWTTK